jgi:hypothetical protein
VDRIHSLSKDEDVGWTGVASNVGRRNGRVRKADPKQVEEIENVAIPETV